MTLEDHDPDRYAYDDGSVCEWAREEARKAVEAEHTARSVYLQAVREAALAYAKAVRLADGSLINRFCMATRRDTQGFEEAIEQFVESAVYFAEEVVDGDLIDQDKLRDLRVTAGEEE